jgi:hypothetical protein
MPARNMTPRRSPPLTPAEEAIILHAVTVGGRSQRSVGDDTTIRGSHDQVRRAVDKAVRADPSLLERYPDLKKASGVLNILDVAATDDAVLSATVADSLAAAGLANADVRITRGFTRVRWRYQITRDADGSVTLVRVPDVETRCEWELPDGAAIRARALEVPSEIAEVTHRPAGGVRRRWATIIGVVTALFVITALVMVLWRSTASGSHPSAVASKDRPELQALRP